MKIPDERIMAEFRYLNPNRRYTICAAVRDVFAETEDLELRKKLKYIEMVAKEIVGRLEQKDPRWLRHFYPLRRDFNSIMNGDK